MKASFKLIIILGLIFTLFGVVWYINEKYETEQLQKLYAEKQQNLKEARDTNSSELLFAPNSLAQQKLVQLGAEANFKTVALTHTDDLTYLHQHWTNWPINRTTLSVTIDQNGQIELLSHYNGETALAHSQVLVKIGQTVYDSTHIPYFDEVLTASDVSKVKEMNSYTAEKDVEIIKQIAQAANEKVEVLLLGRDKSHSFLLSEADKQAIQESYHLALSIQQG